MDANNFKVTFGKYRAVVTIYDRPKYFGECELENGDIVTFAADNKKDLITEFHNSIRDYEEFINDEN